MSEKLGARKSMIYIDVLSILVMITTAVGYFYKNPTIFIIGRFICGVCGGINMPLVMLYIKEMSPNAISLENSHNNWMPDINDGDSPSEISGTTRAICFFMHSLGILSTSLFRLLLNIENPENEYIYVFLFPIITCIIRMAMLILYFNFDTPRYYVS